MHIDIETIENNSNISQMHLEIGKYLEIVRDRQSDSDTDTGRQSS